MVNIWRILSNDGQSHHFNISNRFITSVSKRFKFELRLNRLASKKLQESSKLLLYKGDIFVTTARAAIIAPPSNMDSRLG